MEPRSGRKHFLNICVHRLRDSCRCQVCSCPKSRVSFTLLAYVCFRIGQWAAGGEGSVFIAVLSPKLARCLAHGRCWVLNVFSEWIIEWIHLRNQVPRTKQDKQIGSLWSIMNRVSGGTWSEGSPPRGIPGEKFGVLQGPWIQHCKGLLVPLMKMWEKVH